MVTTAIFGLACSKKIFFRLTRPEYETPFHLLRRAWLIPLSNSSERLIDPITPRALIRFWLYVFNG